MTTTPNHAQVLQQRAGAVIIPAGFPTYGAMQEQPESARWYFYEFAKQLRAELQRHGCLFAEPYDQYVRRVCEELQL